jgi:hypothetical protein
VGGCAERERGRRERRLEQERRARCRDALYPRPREVDLHAVASGHGVQAQRGALLRPRRGEKRRGTRAGSQPRAQPAVVRALAISGRREERREVAAPPQAKAVVQRARKVPQRPAQEEQPPKYEVVAYEEGAEKKCNRFGKGCWGLDVGLVRARTGAFRFRYATYRLV